MSPSMLCTSYQPHKSSQIPWYHSISLYIPVEYNVPCLQKVNTKSSPRCPVTLSISQKAPVSFLACHEHPTSLITLLRYFSFTASDCILQCSMLRDNILYNHSIISQTPCGCIQISGSPGRIPSILCTPYKPHNTSQISWFHSY